MIEIENDIEYRFEAMGWKWLMKIENFKIFIENYIWLLDQRNLSKW